MERRYWDFAKGLIVYILFGVAILSISYFEMAAELLRARGPKASVSLVEVILLAKVYSLVALIVLGGSEFAAFRPRGYIKFCNIVLLLSALLAALVVLAHLGAMIGTWTLSSKGPFVPLFTSVDGDIDGISIAPLVGYMVLNVIIAWMERNNDSAGQSVSRTALRYLTFADLPCVIPIVSVLVLTALMKRNTGEEGEVFFSGAIGMFIVASNILSIAVKNILEVEDRYRAAKSFEQPGGRRVTRLAVLDVWTRK